MKRFAHAVRPRHDVPGPHRERAGRAGVSAWRSPPARQPFGSPDEGLAGDRLPDGAMDRLILERRCLQFSLDQAGQAVPAALQPGQRRVRAAVGVVAGGVAFDRLGRGLQRGGAELADAELSCL